MSRKGIAGLCGVGALTMLLGVACTHYRMDYVPQVWPDVASQTRVRVSVVAFEDRRSPEARALDQTVRPDFVGQNLPVSQVLTVWLAEQLQASGAFSQVEVVGVPVAAGEVRYKGGEGEVRPQAVANIESMRKAYPQTRDGVIKTASGGPSGEVVVTGSVESQEAESYWENMFTGQRRVATGLLVHVQARMVSTGQVVLSQRWSVQHDGREGTAQDGDQIVLKPGESHHQFVQELRRSLENSKVTKQRSETVAEDFARALPWMAYAVNKQVVADLQRGVMVAMSQQSRPVVVAVQPVSPAPNQAPVVGQRGPVVNGSAGPVNGHVAPAVSSAAASGGTGSIEQQLARLNAELDSVRRDKPRVAASKAVPAATQNRLVARKAHLEKLFHDEIKKGLVKVNQVDDRLVISLSGSSLFALGDSQVTSSGKRLIQQVGVALAPDTGSRITVEAHTDNQPVQPKTESGKAPTLQQLTKARAENVARVLTSAGGVKKANIVAVGAGSAHPVASNATATGRQKNRRVEIVVAPRVHMAQADTQSR
jgi:flagellar motor protein MotB